ncbi:YceI family protein [Actinocorallia lasiicapitis]
MSTDYTELTGTYTLDPVHSRVGFSARHAMITKVRGAFNEFEGLAKVDGAKPELSTVQVTIKTASIDTRNEQRDGHLRTGDFLEADKFPEITFVSTGVERDGDDVFKVTGDLTIKDVTKSVTVPFEYQGAATDPYGNHRIGFEGSISINRKDFGVNFSAVLEGGGVLVSDKINLEFEISAIKSS